MTNRRRILKKYLSKVRSYSKIAFFNSEYRRKIGEETQFKMNNVYCYWSLFLYIIMRTTKNLRGNPADTITSRTCKKRETESLTITAGNNIHLLTKRKSVFLEWGFLICHIICIRSDAIIFHFINTKIQPLCCRPSSVVFPYL